jgi:hypothetical protein
MEHNIVVSIDTHWQKFTIGEYRIGENQGMNKS